MVTSVKPSVVLNQHRVEIKHIMNSLGILELKIFGSVARKEDKIGSDIDFIVLPNPSNIFSLYDFAAEAEKLLNVKVNVLSSALDEDFSKSPVYAKAFNEAVAF